MKCGRQVRIRYIKLLLDDYRACRLLVTLPPYTIFHVVDHISYIAYHACGVASEAMERFLLRGGCGDGASSSLPAVPAPVVANPSAAERTAVRARLHKALGLDVPVVRRRGAGRPTLNAQYHTALERYVEQVARGIAAEDPLVQATRPSS